MASFDTRIFVSYSKIFALVIESSGGRGNGAGVSYYCLLLKEFSYTSVDRHLFVSYLRKDERPIIMQTCSALVPAINKVVNSVHRNLS